MFFIENEKDKNNFLKIYDSLKKLNIENKKLNNFKKVKTSKQIFNSVLNRCFKGNLNHLLIKLNSKKYQIKLLNCTIVNRFQVHF